MRAIYYLWVFFNVLLSKFSKKIENFIFFYNNDKLYRFNTINVFQRIFLIFFYNPKYYSRLNLSSKNLNKLSLDRLENFRTLHNFMAYRSNKNKPNTDAILRFKKQKTKYSLVQIICNNVLRGNTFNSQELILVLIIFSKLQKAIKNYKLNFFWERLIPKSSSIINAVLTRKLLEHIESEVSYYKYSLSNFIGFYNFFANIDSYNYDFKDEQLNDRKDKLNNLNPNKNIFIKKIIEINVKKYESVIKSYKKFYNATLPNVNFNVYSNMNLYLYFKNLNNSAILLKKDFVAFYADLFKVKHLPTDVSQYFVYNSNVTSLFIRKNKIFNKGRYSRNRQLYRTGVYWCLILNILGVFGLYYYFYRFTFNFGYFWFPMCILILSIFGSRLVKYRLYNIFNIFKELNLFMELINSFVNTIVVNTWKRIKIYSIKTYYSTKFKIKFFILNFNEILLRMWKDL